MNPLPEYYELLYNAVGASEAMDAFDLKSEEPLNYQKWEKLVEDNHTAQLMLVRYVIEQGGDLIAALKKG